MDERLRRREEFTAVVEGWLPGIYAYFRRLGIAAAVAEDLTQQTFVTAWQNLPRLREAAKMKSWLYGIAYRQYLRHREKTARDQHALRDARVQAAQRAWIAGGNPGGDHRLALQSVRDAVAALPDKYRQPLVLLYWADLSYQQAAKVLSLPLGTLAWRVHKALRMLKQALAESEV
jgi:RNA polymerase sigma-70 factor (ECF subfamily)